MKIIEIAQEIYTSSLDSPTDISVNSISFWLRESIGKLNNLLGLDLTITTSAELSSSLTEAEKSIYKQMYMVKYYDKKARESLGASGVDSVVEISDFGTTVRKTSKSELSKRWMELKKTTQEELDDMVTAYNLSDVRPVQVSGDDIVWSTNGGLSDSLTDSC